MENTNYSLEDIKQFIKKKIGCEFNEILPNTDIVKELGCYGDDLDELLQDYSIKFNVKMDSYLWYFHTDEENNATSIGRVFFKPPSERVERISLTPALLLESANSGIWLVNYPNHSVPKRRYDVYINIILSLGFLFFIVYKCSGNLKQ